MTIQQTLSIIKPDGVKKNLIGEILSRFEQKGLSIIAMKQLFLTKEEAEEFYEIHRKRPFFNDLVTFMSSGPVVVSVLEGEDAVAKNRSIMGATNPAEAAQGTIRRDFASSIDENIVHGSDSHENAIEEVLFFFDEDEIFSKLDI